MGIKVRHLIVAPMAMALAACLEAQETALDIPEDPRGIWYVNDPASTETVDHTVWDSFLQKYNHENPYGDGVSRIDIPRYHPRTTTRSINMSARLGVSPSPPITATSRSHIG